MRCRFIGTSWDFFFSRLRTASGSSSHLNIRTVCGVGRKDVFTPIEMSVSPHHLLLPPLQSRRVAPPLHFHSANGSPWRRGQKFHQEKRGAASRGHSYPLKKTNKKKNSTPFSQPGVITGLSSLSNFTFKEHFSGPPLLIPPPRHN